ncbi:hypothetical protein JHK85_012513 [Glycine max]|nr:hypothetical protein JHK85_012513 [Glycine max]
MALLRALNLIARIASSALIMSDQSPLSGVYDFNKLNLLGIQLVLWIRYPDLRVHFYYCIGNFWRYGSQLFRHRFFLGLTILCVLFVYLVVRRK